MACIECGLEQAVADAGTCLGCGAPLTDAGHPSGTFTSRKGAELHLDSRGITIRSSRKSPARVLSWDEVSWFRDGWSEPGTPEGWVLQIVLADGSVEQATGTWVPGRAQPPAEMLAVIRRAAAAHSIPAVLTGGHVLDGVPGQDAGLYPDPAGEPGVREWTGTRWSLFLQVDPGTGGDRDEETGLSRIWSPLPAAVLHRQSRAFMRKLWVQVVAWVVWAGGLGLVLMVCAVLWAVGLAGGPPNLWKAAFCAAFGVIFLGLASIMVAHFRQQKRIALALRADAVRASAEDDPPVTPTTP
jgi:hypothetical protein